MGDNSRYLYIFVIIAFFTFGICMTFGVSQFSFVRKEELEAYEQH